MNLYCVCKKSGEFTGFIKAEDKKKAITKLKSLPYPCKIYKDGFVLYKKWKGKHRELNYKKVIQNGK